jgi:hypothetical protein
VAEIDPPANPSELGDWDSMWESDGAMQPQRIADLESVDAAALLFLTAGAPRPTLRSLDAMFPRAQKAGLASAPTPFLTGRPHTLIHRDRIYDHGTVGLALPERWAEHVNYALEPLGEIMEVDG